MTPEFALSVVLIIYLWCIGTLLESPYPETLVESYATPLTRLGLLGLVLITAAWSPTAGILAALAFVCLGTDVILFTRVPPRQ
jgi:hypothetical protein